MKLSFNPVPENLRGKILDPYLRELLAEQDKYLSKPRQNFG